MLGKLGDGWRGLTSWSWAAHISLVLCNASRSASLKQARGYGDTGLGDDRHVSLVERYWPPRRLSLLRRAALFPAVFHDELTLSVLTSKPDTPPRLELGPRLFGVLEVNGYVTPDSPSPTT